MYQAWRAQGAAGADAALALADLAVVAEADVLEAGGAVAAQVRHHLVDAVPAQLRLELHRRRRAAPSGTRGRRRGGGSRDLDPLPDAVAELVAAAAGDPELGCVVEVREQPGVVVRVERRVRVDLDEDVDLESSAASPRRNASRSRPRRRPSASSSVPRRSRPRGSSRGARRARAATDVHAVVGAVVDDDPARGPLRLGEHGLGQADEVVALVARGRDDGVLQRAHAGSPVDRTAPNAARPA